MKEVELVDSVDDLRSSSSVRRIRMPDFEVLDARIASALNRIIHNSHFKKKKGSVWRNKRTKKRTVSFVEDRSLTSSTITSESLESIDSFENYADLFTIGDRNDDIQEFDSKWDGFLSMTKVPPDELYDLEIHQKKMGPDYHRLKAMVKRSIEQDLRNWNFGARNGIYERNAVVKNPGTKQRVQRILGDCWQWETNGQCVKGDKCSFRHDTNTRGKVTPSNPSPNSFMQQK